SLSTNFVHTLARRGLTNNDNALVSYYMSLPFTPSFIDIRPVNGIYPNNPKAGTNPLQTAALVNPNDEDVDRFVGSAKATLDIVRQNRVAGQANVNAGTNDSVGEHREVTKGYGFYGQEEFLTLGERLFLSAGFRADRSSNNGDVKHYFIYPKTAGSYRLPAGVGPLGDFKLRVAWGQSGNQPLYGMKFPESDATQNVLGLPGTVVPSVVGNPNVKPERQS